MCPHTLIFVDGVGKSRFIRTCLAESVVEDEGALKRVLPHINLVKKNEVTTVFMDTPGTPQSTEEKLQFETDVRAADVVLLVYHAQPVPYDETRPRDETAQLVRKKLRHWLQRVRILRGEESNFPPVILVGTHIDLRSSMTPGEHADEATIARFYEQIENVNYAEEMQPIFSEYPEVDGGYEVSCTLLLNIRAALLNAHRSVVYPTKPIYDGEKKRLTPQYRACLKRIFSLCDLDCDGVLNDDDISFFNKKTFDTELPSKDLEHVKRIAAYSNAGFVDMERGGAVRFEGFCFWLTVFAEKHEDEVPWQVAYAWGYDRKLQLRPEYLCPRDLYLDGLLESDLVGPSASLFEISTQGIKWLSQLFLRHSRGRPYITLEQWECIWSSLRVEENQASAADVVPFPWNAAAVAQGEVVLVDPTKGIPLQSFVALWNLLLTDNTLRALERTIACASLLGYTHLDDAEEHDAPFVHTFSRGDDDRRVFTTMIVSSNAQIRAGIAGKLTGVTHAGPRACGSLNDEGILLNVECPREAPELLLSLVSRIDCFVFAYGDEPGGWEFCHALAQTIRNSPVLRQFAPVMFLHVPYHGADSDKLSEGPSSASSASSAKSASISYCKSLGVVAPITMDGLKSWEEFRANLISCVVEKNYKRWIIQPGPSVVAILTGVALFGALAAAGWYLWQRSQKEGE